MLYLGQNDLLKIGISWNELIDVVATSTQLCAVNDFAQPIKPYLRYRDKGNRIIAMPAFIGGDKATAGIKWIASFPQNIDRGIQRAHSVTVLNDADTGAPFCIINTTLVSAIRTAAVTGYFIRLLKQSLPSKVTVGISGFGPIGQMHAEMVRAYLGDLVEKILVYDVRPIPDETIQRFAPGLVKVVDRWEKSYLNADVFITCTVSKERYINMPPKRGSLQLNVSLRDYQPELLKYMDHVVVDDWEEICRENTDIEKMSLDAGLVKEQTIALAELKQVPPSKGDVWFFNPMGMAVYDIAIGRYFYDAGIELGIGTNVD